MIGVLILLALVAFCLGWIWLFDIHFEGRYSDHRPFWEWLDRDKER
jgi:hypothetical protein